MNVLLVEDDEQVADFVLAELATAGHQCAHASDGEAGYELASSESFDVMVIDRMMPRLDGLGLIARLRERGDTTPALVLSALGEVDDRVQGLQSGADDYLVKPFDLDELVARLHALMRRAAGSTRRPPYSITGAARPAARR